jgi:hypothetical protein
MDAESGALCSRFLLTLDMGLIQNPCPLAAPNLASLDFVEDVEFPCRWKFAVKKYLVVEAWTIGYTSIQDRLLASSSSGNLKFFTAVAAMAHIVNYDRISNQAATQHFYAPVNLSVFLTMLFQPDVADIVAFNHTVEAILPIRAAALGRPALTLPFPTLTPCFDPSSILCPVPTCTDRSKNSYTMQDKTRLTPAS